ncbi:MAG: ABC transporter permease [Bryobacterales bacterium]|nr:ABC transporter permease [Bryobacterales bacterium]MDE0296886.1 ABC transporter permease [Bryobacterales bacterium]MDE0434496.1 ABC transporter permease [Bryobacterales bacterium]
MRATQQSPSRMAHPPSKALSDPVANVPLPAVSTGAPATRPSFLLSMSTLWWREIRSFYRQRSRVIGVLATPLVFWLLLGSGFGTSLRTSAGDENYLQFFYPGTVVLVVLFTAIFSNMSIIEDRREGFLLSVLVAPVSRWALVLGKVTGATTIGVLQGLLFLPLAPLLGISVSPERIPAILGVLLVLSFGLTGLGFFFAWWLNSVQGFHSVMNIVLMPMWMLSGAVFPADGAAGWVKGVMSFNPLTYGITAYRHYLAPAGVQIPGPSIETCWAVTLVFGMFTLAAACYQAGRSSPEGLG